MSLRLPRPIRDLLPARPPWAFLLVAAASLVIQLAPAWREALLYRREAVVAGEFWRLWTGHLVHFGWPHFLADTGLLLILGLFLEEKHRAFSWTAFAVMPAVVSACLFWLDPAMTRYGGLSALDLGLLLYLVCQGWRRDWTDWFWPAVLVIYIAEIAFEIYQGGTGGGMIRFDEPGIKVATSAHLAAAAYALAAFGFAHRQRRPQKT